MSIRFIYFDLPFWRAEASRLALFLGGIPFEDIRVASDEFQEMKATNQLPYNQLPILEIDGKVIAQSLAIARFCGKKSGFYPVNSAINAALVDELLDSVAQVTELFSASLDESDAEKKAKLRYTIATHTLPMWLGFLERRVATNGGALYCIGEDMTIADLALWRLLGWFRSGKLDGIPTDCIDLYPRLCDHFRYMDNNSSIRTWMRDNYSDQQ
ncbi:MAG: hypothetical protein CMD77_06270 [Gammaproteobacteria bacterium]|nr:hypothetical protein [Gammaproteobacteria bacterium]|tara:strand:+ start:235 stop:873 length:639 start_codon:yes stop_codon:yes gene_type:complete